MITISNVIINILFPQFRHSASGSTYALMKRLHHLIINKAKQTCCRHSSRTAGCWNQETQRIHPDATAARCGASTHTKKLNGIFKYCAAFRSDSTHNLRWVEITFRQIGKHYQRYRKNLCLISDVSAAVAAMWNRPKLLCFHMNIKSWWTDWNVI